MLSKAQLFYFQKVGGGVGKKGLSAKAIRALESLGPR